MKIVRFVDSNGRIACGRFATDETIEVLESVYEPRSATGEKRDRSDVRLLAPIDPPNIIAVGLNYLKHAAESAAAPPEAPVLFLKATTAVAGPDTNIVLPAMAPDEVDYEAELAIVLGREARNVTENDALDYVLGYACANDVSARDCQQRIDRQWARAKSFDTFCPLGPWLETDIDPDNTGIRSRLNGDIMQASNTSDQIFSCAHLISYISHCMTLRPGTLILTGTPEGVGFGRRPPVYLQAGDTIEVEIDGIGTLVNHVCRAKDGGTA